MHLVWNDIRVRAAKFAADWADAHYERGETQSFYDAFFQVFGVSRRRVATFEEPVKKLGNKQGFIDLFWKGVLLVEQKSAGRDLAKAREQALDYFPGLKEQDLPRYVLLCDFQTFHLLDLDTRDETKFDLADLPKHVERFGFILGIEKRVFKDQDPVNILAAELMGRLHDALKEGGYDGHPLERLLVRLLFCLFADDTGIFPERGMLEDYLRDQTGEDGADLGPKLIQLFQVLNTPDHQRQKRLNEDLAKFPYINGDLFAEPLPIPDFDADMREILLEACGFHWEQISPAIFGALFQSVMSAAQRRAQGAHYTTERNILKVIEPLFFDDLRADFERAKRLKRGRETALRELHDRLANMVLFDPACGCGNFLIISYRELRLLEIELLKELHPSGQRELLARTLSRIDVDQFYGIEIDEFPARIAEVAMWMMDHIMNNRLSYEFGQVFARIPLQKSAQIVNGDALEIEWDTVCPPDRCTYLLGNPPFIGAKQQTPAQRAQIVRIADLGRTGGTLDYVAAWFLKAGAFMNAGTSRTAFVSTNSITQGEQTAQLWPSLFDRSRLEITFAHRTFPWGSDARGVAHVHVVIVGLAKAGDEPDEKRLFSYPDPDSDPVETGCSVISPYLFNATGFPNPKLTVREVSSPINGAPRLKTGVQMIDNGIMTFTSEEKAEFLAEEPGAEPWFRQFLGGDEYINGFSRWILYLREAQPAALRALPMVQSRIKQLKKYRANSTRAQTIAMAAFPQRLGVDERLERPYLVIPNTSSERRDYIPIGWLEPEIIANQKLRILADALPWQFAILTSRMHMVWMRAITGRLESRYMYSVGVVYNNFPWPTLKNESKEALNKLGAAVLKARQAHKSSTLADLYDPNLMPEDLTKAHHALDAAVDKLYRKEKFGSDRDRLLHLFTLYEGTTAGFLATPPKKPRTRR